jgi:hypothetical protein
VNRGYTGFAAMRDDDDFAAIRERPEFQNLVARGRLDRRYAAVWHVSSTREGEALYGLDPVANLARAGELVAQGYRPVSLSVTETMPGGLVTAMVWHRPAPSADAKDAVARERAGAAATLLHLGEEGPVWPLLHHSPDPSARSYLVHRVAALGIDPAVLVRRFETEEDVTARRALLLPWASTNRTRPRRAARADAEAARPVSQRPDAGLHGAIDWLPRQRQARCRRRTDRARAAEQPAGDKSWYINSEGQTMTVVRGPVEFTMGSLPSEPNRARRGRHRRRIPRSSPWRVTVTVAEFDRFRARTRTWLTPPTGSSPRNRTARW